MKRDFPQNFGMYVISVIGNVVFSQNFQNNIIHFGEVLTGLLSCCQCRDQSEARMLLSLESTFDQLVPL